MTNDSPGPHRRLRFHPRSLDPLHSIGALRAIDEQAKLNLKRAVPAVLLALACFSFGDHLGGIGLWLDTGVLTPDETVDAILERTAAGEGCIG